MKIQSLSIVVPTNKCINNCKFCCAHMEKENYKNQMDENLPFYDLYQEDYLNRLEFARDNGCNTVMLTGNGEPQQNRSFLQKFGTLNKMLEKPFRNIEMQTTGVLLDECNTVMLTGNGEPQQNRSFLQKFGTLNKMLEKPFRNIEMQTTGVLLDENYLRFLRNHVKVSTISLSISSLNNEKNAEYNGTNKNLIVDIEKLCKLIKKYDFNLRVSINLTDEFNYFLNNYSKIGGLFDILYINLGADQVTFRKLYVSNNKTIQDKWIEEHKLNYEAYEHLQFYLKNNGKKIGTLETGTIKYQIGEMSVVLDEDCMSQDLKDAYKYLILRPDCKLYSLWNTKASLIF